MIHKNDTHNAYVKASPCMEKKILSEREREEHSNASEKCVRVAETHIQGISFTFPDKIILIQNYDNHVACPIRIYAFAPIFISDMCSTQIQHSFKGVGVP